ncbi:MAG: hypothetical protein DRQ88_03715 [Epsilonproteobacteria bacterium]|nr:MAG: hypothetical protein DRQ89_03775 [Campylobacterota bacterium]RLA67282.1 MAG: hypothetical protein DRQ88_03715 [Campylobacterota bacterium]
MKKLFTLLVIAFLSVSVQARDTESKVCIEGQGCGDLHDLKLACTDPGHYNHQNPPTSIQIHCKMFEMGWRMGKPGTMSFPRLRVLTTSVSTNKGGVGMGSIDFNFPTTSSTFPCPNFNQTSSHAEFSFNVTCDEIMDMDNTIDYCNDNMLALVEADESLMVTVPTGKTHNSCGGGGHGQH